jgi:hypothetical protein
LKHRKVTAGTALAERGAVPIHEPAVDAAARGQSHTYTLPDRCCLRHPARLVTGCQTVVYQVAEKSVGDGIYATPASGTHTPTKVADCLSTPPSGCGPLAVSHNGQCLAYYTYALVGAGRIEFIQVARIGTCSRCCTSARSIRTAAGSSTST